MRVSRGNKLRRGVPQAIKKSIPFAFGIDFTMPGFSDIISFTRNSRAWYFNSAGVLVPAEINEPRIDHDPITKTIRGFLIEEQRTNAIRNPRAEGAVVGAPGTPPAGWVATTDNTNGIRRSVVSVGAEDGIPYVDIRFWGTPTTGTQYVDVTFDTQTIAAAAGQTWALSAFVRLMAGSFAGLSSANLLGYSLPNISDNLTLSVSGATGAPLRTQRFAGARTYTDAAITNLSPRIGFNIQAGATVDFTVRIGVPQLELGAFATSPILPPAGTLAQTTRAADIASVNTLSPWFNPTEGTIFVEIYSAPVNNIPQVAFDFVDAGEVGTDRFFARRTASGLFGVATISGGVTLGDFGSPNVIAASSLYKSAVAYKSGDWAVVSNAGAVGSATHAVAPVAKLYIGCNYAKLQQINGWISKFLYFNKRRTNAELQALTARP